MGGIFSCWPSPLIRCAVFRREAQLKSATEYAKTLNAANTEETGDRLSDQGSKCSYEQESAEGAASRTLQGTSSQQAGARVASIAP